VDVLGITRVAFVRPPVHEITMFRCAQFRFETLKHYEPWQHNTDLKVWNNVNQTSGEHRNFRKHRHTRLYCQILDDIAIEYHKLLALCGWQARTAAWA
jgi:hypothetical protein